MAVLPDRALEPGTGDGQVRSGDRRTLRRIGAGRRAAHTDLPDDRGRARENHRDVPEDHRVLAASRGQSGVGEVGAQQVPVPRTAEPDAGGNAAPLPCGRRGRTSQARNPAHHERPCDCPSQQRVAHLSCGVIFTPREPHRAPRRKDQIRVNRPHGGSRDGAMREQCSSVA